MKNRVQYTILLFILLITTLSYGCRSAKDIQTLLITQDMESVNNQSDTFNIETYNKNKSKFGLYKKIVNDITISQNLNNYSKYYYEILEQKNSLVSQYSSYYLNGKLREKGNLYNKHTLSIGTWYFYDEAGNLTKTIDYDIKSKITWKKEF